ncbi:FecR domain-containing protein [Pseudomonas sp. Irchel 3E20]|uniref:FecR domain-containing protein n=1 Tax=Pseudomonas sp. Irchel 3E20 TaxID=2008983 RepID=UPI000BA4487D|nr:FecR domain-containing protein [Pseudomonas sp. Irchel 3E20]
MSRLLSSLPAAELAALSAAAQWFARLESGTATAEDQQAWHRWRGADPLHEQAWQRMESVREQLAGVPGKLAAPALRGAERSRRQVLRSVLVLASAGSVGWLGWRSEASQQRFADYHTAVGERREVRLADGSSLLLNTNTSVNVRFDGQQRLLHLLAGEILVSTAADPLRRPFRVETRQGRVLALGTRFIVRAEGVGGEVAVLDKAVQVSLAGQRTALRLEAGQRVALQAQGLGPVRANDASVGAWQQGSLIAIDRPLGELLAELARYRVGVLRCDPAIAGLKVSGAFPLDDTDLALAALHSAFGLKITRYTRYWVSVSA